ncbi:MAG: UDP-N-acetylmuramate--L-alanine ligase [Myxococcota bacterium]|nr:UDP-N-acetylmuramate--L-alanine ligase [Myxococcota bacterium]
MTGRMRGIDRIHFVGIGGSGMSGIAELLHHQGYRVSGSDVASGASVERLIALGVSVSIGHAAEHAAGADVVVVSTAIREGNPEVEEARRAGVPVIPRAEMLAELMRLENGIAVAGTHGKTTTTSLIAHVLEAAGLDPTAVVGGRLSFGGGSDDSARTDDARTGARLGRGGWLVAEADESDGSFLRLHPVISVITNVEPEHLDHWGDGERLEEAFVEFASRVPFFGRVVVCLDDPGVQRILPRIARRTLTYGFTTQAEWRALSVEPEPRGMRFEVRHRGEPLGKVALPLVGRHNVANALAALAVAGELEVPFETAAAALSSFGGVERRFETRGTKAGVRVVDDYGHHPTEIRATLAAARGAHAGRLVVVFQPHRFTRTRDLLAEFGGAFHDADVVLVCDVYPAGEDPIPGADAAAVVRAITERGHRAVRSAGELDTLAARLVPELRPGDLVLTLGAGSIHTLGPRILAALEETPS